jgi:hypothetical protein
MGVNALPCGALIGGRSVSLDVAPRDRAQQPGRPEPGGRVDQGGPAGNREIVADGLFFPGGVALSKNDEIYVTNCGVCFDDGEVLRINP